MTLTAAIDALFNDELLYDPLRVAWRQTVVDDGGQPIAVPIVQVLHFAEISTRLTRPSTHPDSVREVTEAAAASESVAVVDVGGTACLMRKSPLREEDNPTHRTIVARPIHPAASDAEIRTFFETFGEVERLARETFQMGGGGERPRAAVAVRFRLRAGAMAAVAAAPSYGTLPHALGQHFVPSLVVQTQTMANAAAALQVDRREAATVRSISLAATTALTTPKIGSSADAGVSTHAAVNVSRYLTKGRTLLAEDVPPTATWRTIKQKLGNLAAADRTLVGVIELVQVEGKKAYVVLRSEAAAHTLLTAWAAKAGPFAATLHETVPKLRMLPDEEEPWVRSRFPAWAAEHKKCKISKNEKRNRDE